MELYYIYVYERQLGWSCELLCFSCLNVVSKLAVLCRHSFLSVVQMHQTWPSAPLLQLQEASVTGSVVRQVVKECWRKTSLQGWGGFFAGGQYHVKLTIRLQQSYCCAIIEDSHSSRDSQCFKWARQPLNCPFPWGSRPHPIHDSLGLKTQSKNGILIDSAVFAQHV